VGARATESVISRTRRASYSPAELADTVRARKVIIVSELRTNQCESIENTTKKTSLEVVLATLSTFSACDREL